MENLQVLKKTLVKKWSGVTGPLNIKSIGDNYIRENMAILLENQESGTLNEAITPSNWSTLDASTNQDWRFRPIALALQRRTFPELFANKCVGVQPLAGPVGLAFALRFTYNKNGQGYEAGWDRVRQFAGYSGGYFNSIPNMASSAYLSAYDSSSATLPSTSAALTSANLYNQTTTAGIYDTSAQGLRTGQGESLRLDDGTMSQMGFRIDRVAVEAKTRKLGASYSLESAQDIRQMQGLDIERELVEMMQYEIMAEIDQETIMRMKSVATFNSSALDGGQNLNGGVVIPAIDITASGTGFNPNWGGQGEKFINIVSAIINQANNLRYTTRQGKGNFVVVSPAIATALSGAGHQFVQFTSNVNIGSNMSAAIGKLDGGIEVYVDQYASQGLNYALTGLRDKQKFGIVFCPYVLGLNMRATDPNNFYPTIGAMSRYAFCDSLLGAGRYYRLMSFTNVGALIAGADAGIGIIY